MSLFAAVGAAPWKPTEDSEMVDEWHYYDIPLMGVVRQDGKEYVFSCVWGEIEETSAWEYREISSGEREWLEGCEPGMVFSTNVALWCADRAPCTVAVYNEHHGIVVSWRLR